MRMLDQGRRIYWGFKNKTPTNGYDFNQHAEEDAHPQLHIRDFCVAWQANET